MKIKGIFILLPLFCLTACNTTYYAKPDDTNLEFWISDRPTEGDLEKLGYKEIEDGFYGGIVYLAPGYETKAIETYDNGEVLYGKSDIYVTYSISGYPDYSDKKAVTSIEISDPSVTVFGLTIESEQSTIEEKMKSLKFKQDSDYNTFYKKGKLQVQISKKHIWINVETTNRNFIKY